MIDSTGRQEKPMACALVVFILSMVMHQESAENGRTRTKMQIASALPGPCAATVSSLVQLYLGHAHPQVYVHT